MSHTVSYKNFCPTRLDLLKDAAEARGLTFTENPTRVRGWAGRSVDRPCIAAINLGNGRDAGIIPVEVDGETHYTVIMDSLDSYILNQVADSYHRLMAYEYAEMVGGSVEEELQPDGAIEYVIEYEEYA